MVHPGLPLTYYDVYSYSAFQHFAGFISATWTSLGKTLLKKNIHLWSVLVYTCIFEPGRSVWHFNECLNVSKENQFNVISVMENFEWKLLCYSKQANSKTTTHHELNLCIQRSPTKDTNKGVSLVYDEDKTRETGRAVISFISRPLSVIIYILHVAGFHKEHLKPL